jgi:hypothetical protein
MLEAAEFAASEGFEKSRTILSRPWCRPFGSSGDDMVFDEPHRGSDLYPFVLEDLQSVTPTDLGSIP